MAIERILDRYDVEARLGAGGMGDVWRATDDLLGRSVAIKFVGEKELRDSPGAAAILRDEARHAGQLLGHANVVAVLDLIEVDTVLHQGPAIVLEHVDGCHLGEWIQQYRPSLNEFTRMQTGLFIGLQVIEAIQFAHKQTILHRDVKPQNVLLAKSGNAKVADFGLSRVVEEITRTHTVWGRHTPLYAAPEQWEGEKPDEQSDVYQLSATIYHLLAGVPANQGSSLLGLLRWHETNAPKPLAEIVPGINVDVSDVLQKGLAKSPDERTSLWKLVDVFSGAMAKTLRLTAKLDVESDGSHRALAEAIANFTDFSLEDLSAQGSGGATFPNPYEAIQEAIGVALLGGHPVLAPSGRGRVNPPSPAPNQPQSE